MKRPIMILFALMFLLFFTVSQASAESYLYDWAFNVDGTTYEASLGDAMPTTGSLDSEGLGTLTINISGTGNHNFIAFFDYEIDEATNTFFNEYGAAINAPGAGQSWEIDEPGWVFGDIYDNVLAGSLDNTNAINLTDYPDGEDVSMALGWNFNLLDGQTALITLLLSDIAPGSGFYLVQTDPDSQESIYFSSTIDITGGGTTTVPEPATMFLLGIGLLGIFGIKKKI